jgi:hypothetical protein
MEALVSTSTPSSIQNYIADLGGDFVKNKVYREQVEALAVSNRVDRFSCIIRIDEVLAKFGWSDEITKVYRLGASISLGRFVEAVRFARKNPSLLGTATDYSQVYQLTGNDPAHDLMEKVRSLYSSLRPSERDIFES